MNNRAEKERAVLVVAGTVQGVGFRPFVYRLAVELGLAGGVANTGAGVEIEIEGPPAAIDRFLARLPSELPPLARIERLTVERRLSPAGRGLFAIGVSSAESRSRVSIPPDVAVCPDCLRELFDPADRRYRYPFINCTNCGPRYTIALGHPYDRRSTTMKQFAMCPRCRAEYDNPLDRRFHAQPNACPECGPRLWLVGSGGAEVPGDPIESAREALRDGRIVAVKGLGGFHLAVNALDHRAVRRLRERKRREEKPLAMMAPDASAVRRFARLTPAEAAVLTSPISPIVLLEKKRNTPISPAVADGVPTYGFMLPYTPLHHLLIRGLMPALVMTSGNLSEEPMAADNDEAVASLSGIADLFLLHDRPIATACDDSVVRVINGRLRIFRRARGFVPEALPTPEARPGEKAVLALGSEYKNSFAISGHGVLYPGPHVGDLVNAPSYRHFVRTIESYKKFLRIEPEMLAVDLHPDYTNRDYARLHPELPAVEVQHHHAHLASILAEHGEPGPAIGLIMDGSGFGGDGTVWGGEFLVGDAVSARRAGHLRTFPLPGGDKAVSEPWRAGLGLLYSVYGRFALNLACPFTRGLDKHPAGALMEAMEKRVNCPLTSSLGRLFDAVAALAGLKERVSFEGQAAMALENELYRSDRAAAGGSYRIPVRRDNEGLLVADSSPMVRRIIADLNRNRPIPEISLKFHRAVVNCLARTAGTLRDQTGIDRVVLAGGCYQNSFLLTQLEKRLTRRGFAVLSPGAVPIGDGGLAVGQAHAALCRAAAEKREALKPVANKDSA